MFEKNRNSEEQNLILKNLDIMASENKAISKPQQHPSLARAQEQLKPILMRDQNGQSYSLTCSLEEFKKYGPGVYLIFKFMKFLLIVMTILLPLPLTNMIILAKSEDKYNDTNFETSLEATTFNGTNNANPLMFGFNFAVLLFLTIALIYWKQNEPKLVFECTNQICLPSYFTVILTDIPNHYTEHDFKEYIQEKYGKIYDIYTAKNYHEDIKQYKLMYDIIEEFKEERQFFNQNKDKQSCIKLVELFLKYRELHQILNDNASDQKIYEPFCAFITFENSMQKAKLLSDQETKSSFFSCFKWKNQQNSDEQVNFNTQKIKFKPCSMEPDGVSWENLNMTTKQMAIRCGLITFLLLLFLFIAITIIFVFVAAQSGLYLDKYSELTFEQIVNLNQTQALMSYCLDLSYSKFHQISECQQFHRDYINYFALFLIFPLVITILKMIFASIMKQMVEIRRHKNNFEKVQWQVIIISLFYFIKAALIKFVIYRQFTFGNVHIELLEVYLPILMKLKTFLPIYPEGIHIFHSFSGEWVAHASHKIILIGIFSFNFTILYHYFHGLISKKYRQYKASKMLTQRRINQLLKGQQFEIQIIYSQIIALFLFCMMYFSCMPIIYVLVLFSLFLIYWTSKYSLINFCRKPIVYAHGINTLAVKIIFYGLILNCIVSPIYYQESIDSEEQPQYSLFSQMINHWYYLTLLLIISIYLMGGNNLIYKIYNKIRVCINPRYKNQSYRNHMKQISRGKGKMQSYSMHQNQKYSKILEILFIINKIQINKIGYFNHSKIEMIKSEINRREHSCTIFHQILQNLREQSGRLDKDKETYEKFMKILEDIEGRANSQVADQLKEKQMQVLIKSKIRQLNANQSILKDTLDIDHIIKLKSQIKSQLSNDMNMENAPQTEKRLH